MAQCLPSPLPLLRLLRPPPKSEVLRTRAPPLAPPSTKFEQRRELLCNGGGGAGVRCSQCRSGPRSTMKESTVQRQRRCRGGADSRKLDSRKNDFPGTHLLPGRRWCVALFLLCVARVSAGQRFEDDFLLRESVSAADPRTARKIFDDFEREASPVLFHICFYLLRSQQDKA